jgi:hypothetical protein
MSPTGERAIAILSTQHRYIDEQLEQLSTAPPTGATLGRVAQLGKHILAHLAAEEGVFYPATQGVLLGRDAERGRDDHLLVRLRLRGVVRANTTGTPLQEAVIALRRAFARHIRLEENEIFPYVERRMPPDKLQALGDALAAGPRVRTFETQSAIRARP